VLKIKDEIGLEFAVRGSGTVLYESIATRGNQKTKVFELSWRGLGFVPSSYPDRFVNSQPCPDRSGWYFCPEWIPVGHQGKSSGESLLKGLI